MSMIIKYEVWIWRVPWHLCVMLKSNEDFWWVLEQKFGVFRVKIKHLGLKIWKIKQQNNFCQYFELLGDFLTSKVRELN